LQRNFGLTETRISVPEPSLATLTSPLTLRRPRRVSLKKALLDYGLPLFLLSLSILTTTAIGARFMFNFLHSQPAVISENDLWPWPWLFADPARFHLGWSFSAALLGILLTHEFGHYFACRAHGIRATLPWVLPAPTLSGTAGAVIQIRSRIPSRRALVDVGIYGPLAGFLASLIAVTIGLLLSHTASPGHATALIGFGEPLTLQLVPRLLAQIHPATPAFHQAICHPVLIAGWVGLFITALNLIPGGQLDGGHLLYALSPRWHRWITRALPIVLLAFGFFFWIGWVLWGALLIIPAMRRHPRVPAGEALGAQRTLLCLLALAIFALTFAAEPFPGSSILNYLR
jgi:membrane-associated protease RseP (regulator of RpoE activity)